MSLNFVLHSGNIARCKSFNLPHCPELDSKLCYGKRVIYLKMYSHLSLTHYLTVLTLSFAL